MNPDKNLETPATGVLMLYEPDPDAWYSLEEAARLTGVPRRSILMYCHAGLVRPVYQAPYGAMGFAEDGLVALRRIHYLQGVHTRELDWIKTVFALLGEVDRLRSEVRFWRNP